ncbi:MAG: MFS transporter [Proteobacteria bacterium]|nr:MFS transporter [Pseudomonadota bacterium]
MEDHAVPAGPARTRVRYTILCMLFVATTIGYADRASLSITGAALHSELGLNAVTLGYIFSAFGWSYVAAQIPGGWLLDRFGSRRVYAASILLWSLFTLLQGTVGLLTGGAVVLALFTLRLLVGMAEAPAFPGNSRIVAAWFPTAERGTAAAVFNSAQYFATVIFLPLEGWITHRFGWRYVFYTLGGLGLAVFVLWLRTIYSPRQHPRASRAEIDFIARGGALVDMDHQPGGQRNPRFWADIKRLLSTRMLVGVYIGQYCITTLTYFFLTWFPIYLVEQRGMSILKAGFVASLPAVCGFAGGVLGGIFSDALLRRGYTLTAARKIPIVAGMLLSTCMIGCNYIKTDALVVVVMSLAFFGKGIGALGWAVVADTSPKEIAGVSGALFNTFGNMAAITTPIVIGYIVAGSGSFAGALVFVGANAVAAVISYLLIVGPIERIELGRADGQQGTPPQKELLT